MADEIIIGRLIIDNSDLDRAMLESKKSVLALEEEQKKLKKETENLTTATDAQLQKFIQNEASLKAARAEYSANQRTVLALTAAQTGLDAELAKSITTQDAAIANTKALTAARRQIDATTTDGAKAIADINTKIDANNKLVNASSSALEQQKNNVGNYPTLMGAVSSSFSGATSQVIGFAQQGKQVLGELSGTVENYRAAQEASTVATEAFAAAQVFETQATEAAAAADAAATRIGFQYAAGKATETEVEIANTAAKTANSTATAAQAATTQAGAVATNAATTASKALRIAMLAIPIFALLALLAPLISYFTSTQEGIDKVTAVTRPLVAIFDGLIGLLQKLGGAMVDAFSNPKQALSDLSDFVKQNLINRFTAFGEILDGILSLDFEKVTNGALQAATGVEDMTGKIAGAAAESAAFLDEAIRKGQELDRLEKSLETTRNNNILLLGQLNEEVKAQNRIAEDQTKPLKAREEATAKSIVAAKEINRLKNAELDIEIAILKNKQSRNDTSREEIGQLNALIAKKNENNAAELELETTQNNKLVALRKEASDKAAAAAKEAFDKQVKEMRNRIDIMKLEADQSTLTTAQRINNAQKVFDLENELAKKTLSGSDERKALIENRQALSTEILAIANEQIEKELTAQKKAFGETKKITDEQKAAQLLSAEDLARAQILLLDKNLLTEKAYADEVVKINAGKIESIDIINKNFEEGEKARRETQLAEEKLLEEAAFQIRLLDIQDRAATELEIKAALLMEEYSQELYLLEESLKNKEISEEVYNAKRIVAEKKYAADVKKNDKILAEQKRANNISMANDAIGALQGLFGESKALSVASALINTYQGITAGVKLGYPMAIPAVAFAAATGFAAVKNILKTSKSSSGGGEASAPAPVTTSGAGSFVNSAQTNTVATVSEAPTNNAPIVTPPVLVLETLAEVQNNVAMKVNSN